MASFAEQAPRLAEQTARSFGAKVCCADQQKGPVERAVRFAAHGLRSPRAQVQALPPSPRHGTGDRIDNALRTR